MYLNFQFFNFIILKLYIMNFCLIILCFIIFTILIISIVWNKQDKTFFKINELNPELQNINTIHENILQELQNSAIWHDWPEKYLYQDNKDWKILPLNVFGTWSVTNCNKMPILTKFLKSIKGLRVALISNMGPGTKLIPHKGWGFHSNFILRYHYGLIIPEKQCYMAVKQNDKALKYDIQYHKEKEWIIFDDSKEHYAENTSAQNRIVLIIDIDRPFFVKKGTSTVKNSAELQELVDQFKKSEHT